MLYNLDRELVGSRRKFRNKVQIQDLEYAGDMALHSSMAALEEVLKSLDDLCTGVGLSISSKKTKVLAIRPSAPPQYPSSPHPSKASGAASGSSGGI